MRCKNITEKFPDFLIGDIDKESKEEILSHVRACSSCREELEGLSETWTKLGVLPEERPSNNLRSRFYGMLETYKKGLEHEKPRFSLRRLVDEWVMSWWPKRPVFQFSLTLFILAVGLATGYFLSTSAAGTREFSQLQQEVRDMRQIVAVSLLDKPSPSDRLKGISWSSRIERPNAGMLEALINTLNNDPNVNVRLSVVDALYLFYDHPVVKQGLTQSLIQQTSPLVQVAIIDLITGMRERQAIESLKNLIQTDKLAPEVKQHAELGIQKINM